MHSSIETFPFHKGKPIVIMNRGLRIAALAPVAIVVGLAGCGGATDDLPRQAVSGTITLDGAPLASGAIAFDPEVVPADPVSAGGVISEGSYEIPQAQGPTPGTYRVSIRSVDSAVDAGTEPPGATPRVRSKDKIPPQYNAKSTLKAEVKADGPNTFDFDLTSK